MVGWAELYAAPVEPEHRDIAVLSGSGRRVAAKARELAASIGCYVKEQSGEMAEFLDREKPELILFAPEPAILEPILRWAQKHGLAVIGPCSDVSIDPATREAAGRRPLLGGVMTGELATPKRPQIFALDPAALPEPAE